MDIANMYELLNMLHDFQEETTIEDFCFEKDGKSVWVRLRNGNEYRFNVK